MIREVPEKEYRPDLKVNKVVLQIAEMLKDKKARDILVLDLNGLTNITDYFIICTANSTVQIRALMRFIEEFMHGSPVELLSKNVSYDSPWVLLDYNYFVIHILLYHTTDLSFGGIKTENRTVKGTIRSNYILS